ncbi:MAG: ABC transporter substrate-binding protein [Thermodesulfobacteriota bacterium]|nr:ABC transporter substrate-binding protein [Thermodesulfobacteriota bacterium]
MKREFAVRNCSSWVISLLLMSSVVLFYPTVGNAESVRGVTDTTIKIGGILDQTGPFAGDITLPASEALRNYTRYVNDGGGIFGRKIKLIIEDDHYSIPVGIAAFKKLLFKDRIFALVGPASTPEAKALYGQIERLKVPNISGAPDETQVSPLKRYIFMPFNVYDDHLGIVYDHIVNDLKPKRLNIILVYPDAETGKIALACTKKWAKHFNFTFHTEILNLSVLDATSQVMSIRRKKPTHIVIHHGSAGAVMLLRDLRKFGLNIPVYGDMLSCTEDTAILGGDASKNYFGVHPFSSWYEVEDGVQKMRKITLQYKPGTEKPYRNKFYVAGWVISRVIYEGIKRAGKDLNSESMVAALESFRNFDTKGVCGPITFTPTEHQGIYHAKLYKADPDKGELVPLSGWRLPPLR